MLELYINCRRTVACGLLDLILDLFLGAKMKHVCRETVNTVISTPLLNISDRPFPFEDVILILKLLTNQFPFLMLHNPCKSE